MPAITKLTFYPIKSCAGIALTEATLTSGGLRHENIQDREWMVVDAAGRFLTQRDYPRMALIVPSLHQDGIRLTAPGGVTFALPLTSADRTSINVIVWDDVVSAQDCGDGAADWLYGILGVRCRLVHFGAASRRIASKKWTAGREIPTLFSDGYPMLLISQASLDDLNQKLQAQGRNALPMNRFRPNIVIDGVMAFEEDFMLTISAGKAQLQPVKPCPRCPMPSIDQATGQYDADPLDILQTYRVNPKMDGAITFGMNTILLEGAGEILRVGQEITIELGF
ncbi:MOSC domain-containing protein [Glaciimonas immobilis]|uniref:MOSC domain-containing protein n=1 Tax=Glaciimonas immobilis TaxID=728004 RepID=A0A840RUH3_9BURK|nr:MOSC N-terminal beta barrel domain-containing protein [Glaciimonas immobilis]KAF3999781.1 MOSC domain-containing protein [Glaciimonas immobilis]MBB5200251.1 hypothetical protein [Glaciimonas immobilis]